MRRGKASSKSLAGGFWERIGYKGWGEKVSLGEAKRALSKAKAHSLGTQSNMSRIQNSETNLEMELGKEAWEEGLAYDKYTGWAKEAQRLGKYDLAQVLRRLPGTNSGTGKNWSA